MGDVIDFEMGRNNLPIAFVFCFSFPQLHLSLHYHFFFCSLLLSFFILFIYLFFSKAIVYFIPCMLSDIIRRAHVYTYKRVRKKICYWLTMVSRGCGGIKKKKGGTARRKSNEKKNVCNFTRNSK
ncbi:Uncharacterized protein APZ42_027973 [Daphnia magna]|uniref:Uncharacterized protein n=1 Tax=Daphnia magna TaxID=35525 RepID=A0A164QXF3_9CRUS|nr:Uncharacterized protein APZ42_027973 [Daphnia magna]